MPFKACATQDCVLGILHEMMGKWWFSGSGVFCWAEHQSQLA